MREIEFRGKATASGMYKKWVYGNFEERNGHYTIYEKTHFSDTPKGYYIGHGVYLETVGQYTGLKDKNGVKIFEGDVVIFNDDAQFHIRYRHGAFWLIDDEGESYLVGITIRYVNDNVRVIGNIHDNPELKEAAE